MGREKKVTVAWKTLLFISWAYIRLVHHRPVVVNYHTSRLTVIIISKRRVKKGRKKTYQRLETQMHLESLFFIMVSVRRCSPSTWVMVTCLSCFHLLLLPTSSIMVTWPSWFPYGCRLTVIIMSRRLGIFKNRKKRTTDSRHICVSSPSPLLLVRVFVSRRPLVRWQLVWCRELTWPLL